MVVFFRSFRLKYGTITQEQYDETLAFRSQLPMNGEEEIEHVLSPYTSSFQRDMETFGKYVRNGRKLESIEDNRLVKKDEHEFDGEEGKVSVYRCIRLCDDMISRYLPEGVAGPTILRQWIWVRE